MRRFALVLLRVVRIGRFNRTVALRESSPSAPTDDAALLDALAWIRVSDVHELKRVIDRLRGSGHVIGTKTLMVLGTSAPNSIPPAVRGR